MNNPKVRPALIAGSVFGVLAAVPIVSNLNTLCCALYIGGGVLAVYLYLRDIPRPDDKPSGDGAVLGALTGLFGAVVETILGSTLRTVYVDAAQIQATREQVQAGLQELANMGIELPSELPPLLMEMIGMDGLSVLSVLFSLVASAILFVIFGTIGALIGVAIFYKKENT